MISIRLRPSLVLLAVAFTAACGSEEGSGGPAFADSVSTADAENFAGGVASFANQVASSMNFGGPSIGLSAPVAYTRIVSSGPLAVHAAGRRHVAAPDFSLLDWRTASRLRGPQAVAPEGCTYSGHGTYGLGGGDPVDVNANGIPDDFLIRIECTMTDSTSAVDTIFTQTILQEIAVKEISGSLYGQTVSIVLKQRWQDNHLNFEEVELNGRGRQDIRSNSIVDESSFTVRQAYNDDGTAWEGGAGESWDNAFDPASAITLGGDIPDGDLTIGGRRYYYDTDDVDLSFGIETTTPLAYNAACAAALTTPPFTAGVLRGRLNNNAAQANFLVTFTACGSYTIDVNGAFDEIAVVAGR